MIEAQRADSISRGPIHQIFATFLTGLVTIRAYKKSEYFKYLLSIMNDKCANVTFTYLTANRWMGIRYDMAVVMVTFFASISVIACRGLIEDELLSFTLQNLTDVVVHFSVSLRMIAELQNFMTCSQRAIGYTKLPQEDDLVKDFDKKLKQKRDAKDKR
jgi:hypothetical protein